MTNKRFALIICALMIGSYFLLRQNHAEITETKNPTIESKTEATRSPASIPAAPLVAPNKPSPEWKSRLEQAIRTQAGPQLKELSIQKVDSFVWKEGGIPLHVESAIVVLKNDKNTETSYRVLVDSETGKILRSWDAPVVDPVNPRDNLRVKMDPIVE